MNSTVKAQAIIRIPFSKRNNLKIAFKALEPEISESTMTRSQTILKKEDSHLIINIDAQDTVALRAAINTYLRLISSIFSVHSTLQALMS
jgi:KEOPS complex subunit Pcc1